ncbi:histidine phosphatase superfamily [Scleroderma yunnanense]
MQVSFHTSIPSIYNSSTTPSHLPWNTYNYCNAPHINAGHYVLPNASTATLVFVAMVMRHHKRTPDNLYPSEHTLNPSSGWNCSDIPTYAYAAGTAHIFTETSVPPDHPFGGSVWAGTCRAGQVTSGGLQDAVKHGQDFWGVYHNRLAFVERVCEEEIFVRTSGELRTQVVAGAMLYGMDPNTAKTSWRVHTQPANIDSLVPAYACPAAGELRSAAESTPAWKEHLVQYEPLQRRLDNTLGTGRLVDWHSWYDHFFDSFTARTCHLHPLPCNATGGCVTQEDAADVFTIGDWEYNYLFNSAPQAREYVRLTYGVFFAELAHTFRRVLASGSDMGSEIAHTQHKIHMYVGHDGSMVRLASGLGLGGVNGLRWPAMGSEIVIEVWHTSEDLPFVRVLYEGSPVHPPLDWMPLDQFVRLLEGLVPEDLKDACMQPEKWVEKNDIHNRGTA